MIIASYVLCQHRLRYYTIFFDIFYTKNLVRSVNCERFQYRFYPFWQLISSYGFTISISPGTHLPDEPKITIKERDLCQM